MISSHIIDDIDAKCSKYINLSKYIYSHGGILVIVGGYIRNIICNIECNDCDAEVYFLSQDKLIRILSVKYRTLLVGVSFAVIKLVDENIDISLPRKDICIGDTHRSFNVCVDEFMSYYACSMRRDLTINAIGYCLEYKILFDYHHGMDDIRNKIITPVDVNRFMEDPLRLLRAVYFATKLQFSFSSAMYKLYKQYVYKTDNVSLERIGGEIYKIFMCKHTSLSFKYLSMLDNNLFNFAKYIYSNNYRNYICCMIDKIECVVLKCIFVKILYHHCDFNVLLSKFPTFKLKLVNTINDTASIITLFYKCEYCRIFLIIVNSFKLKRSNGILRYLYNISQYIHIDRKLYLICHNALIYCHTMNMQHVARVVNEHITYVVFKQICDVVLNMQLYDVIQCIHNVHIISAYYCILFCKC